MTTKTPISLTAGTQLPTDPGSLYSVAQNSTVRITALTLCNSSSSPVPVSLYIVPKGSTAEQTTAVLSSFSLAPGESYVANALIGHVLASQTSLWGSAGVAASVGIIASGELVQP